MRRLLVGLAIAGIAFLSPLAAIADDDQIAQQIFAKLKEHQRRGELLKGFDINLVVDRMVRWCLRVDVSDPAQAKARLGKPLEEVEGRQRRSGNDLLVGDSKSAAANQAKFQPLQRSRFGQAGRDEDRKGPEVASVPTGWCFQQHAQFTDQGASGCQRISHGQARSPWLLRRTSQGLPTNGSWQQCGLEGISSPRRPAGKACFATSTSTFAFMAVPCCG